MTRVEVVIDEVVVRGLSPADARALAATLQARLEARMTAWAATGETIGGRQEASRRLPDGTTDDLADAVWSAVVGRRG